MQIIRLEITNFKSIRHLQLDSIPTLVVVAGPNGSGKSALFDALRVFKESVAGYSFQWPGSSSIHEMLREIGPVITLGQDQASISVSLQLSANEQQSLELPAGHDGILGATVTLRRGELAESVDTSFENKGGDREPLRRLFSEGFRKESGLSVVDHIGPDRSFAQTQVGSINFSPDSTETELRGLVAQSKTKFQNLRQDLVMMHLVDLQAKDRGDANPVYYIDGVREIFSHFLPEYEFIGVEIPVGFSGPPKILVRSGGVEHDINLLSSGQREVLMTYTHLERLRPTGSIILFDEPELHLHPTLQRRVIGHLRRLVDAGNQVWLATHSEEIVGTTEYEYLYAMTGRGDPAVVPVADRAARLEVLRNLGASVGLQLTSPRTLFVEGDSDEEILPLFHDALPPNVAIVSTGGKTTLMRMTGAAMRLLEEVIREGNLYFVRDRDVEDDAAVLDELQGKYQGKFFVWDRYHIENYLLDEQAIHDVLDDDEDIPSPPSPQAIRAQLKAIADARRGSVMARHLEARINAEVRRRVRVNEREDVRESLLKAAETRLAQVIQMLEPQAVAMLYEEVCADLEARWDTEWPALCIGRDVLTVYHREHVREYFGYELFRNRVARKMRELDRVPPAIANVLAAIAASLGERRDMPNEEG